MNVRDDRRGLCSFDEVPYSEGAAMPNRNRLWPVRCPKCDHSGSRLVLASRTIMTLKCSSCGHTWATDLETLTPDIQQHVRDMLEDDERS